MLQYVSLLFTGLASHQTTHSYYAVQLCLVDVILCYAISLPEFFLKVNVVIPCLLVLILNLVQGVCAICHMACISVKIK